MPTAAPLRITMAATLLLLVPAFLVRSWIAILYWRCIGDIWTDRQQALDEVHTADSLVLPDALAVILSVIVVAVLSWRWSRACYANALTRADVGMAWVRQVHSRPAYLKAQKAQAATYTAAVLAGIVIRSPGSYDLNTLNDIRPLFLVQAAASLLCLLAVIEAAVLARRMTVELMTAVEYSELRERRLVRETAGSGRLGQG